MQLVIAGKVCELLLFNVAIDDKLRDCAVVAKKLADVFAGGEVKARVSIIQRKTRKPVRFEITEPARRLLAIWRDDPKTSVAAFNCCRLNWNGIEPEAPFRKCPRAPENTGD